MTAKEQSDTASVPRKFRTPAESAPTGGRAPKLLFSDRAATLHSQARYEALIQATAQIVWTTDASGSVVEESPSWHAFTGQTYEQCKGFGWLDALHPDDQERTSRLWQRSVADRIPMECEYRIRHVSGDWRWTSVRAVPVFGPDGFVREWVGMNSDITEQKQAEEALRESEERYRALFDMGPVAVYSCDTSGVIQEFNRRAATLWGREPAVGDTDERFCGSFKLFRPDGSFMPHEQCPMAEVVSGKISETRDAEVHIERPDGSRITVVVNILPLKNQRGEVAGAINCFYDITERKEAEQRQHFLMNELAHRGKNLLAVVQSIASRSLSGTRPLAEARNVLSQRLQALARSHSVLEIGGFEGASMAEIIRLQFEAFSDRVKAVGPDVMLNPKVAQTFALVVHELATNAIKHGPLSQPDGQVAIHWSMEGAGTAARFKFRWQERNGPPVKVPTHEGFGRTLLEKAAAHDFGAMPKIDFASEGLSYEIDAPLSAVAVDSAAIS